MAYDVSRIQKRTRDKEYRLRKQGANDAAIAGVSPRKSWAEVKAMTTSQQQAYAKRLELLRLNGSSITRRVRVF